MNASDSQAPAVKALGLALLIPIAVAGMVALLAAQSGPHEVVLAGVPRDELIGLEVVSTSEAKVSREAALAPARQWADGAQNGQVRQMALGRYSDEAVEYVRGRLVWVISFEPDPLAPVFIGGPPGVDHSCDWAFHHGYILTTVDANTGEVLSSGGAALFDPSLTPTFDSDNNSDRAYCERLMEENQRAARDSLTP